MKMEERSNAEESGENAIPANIVRTLEDKGIHLRDVIGNGAFSSVRLAWHDSLKTDVAIKIVKTIPNTTYIIRFLSREMCITKRVIHSNIIRTYNIIEKHAYVCFVQEYAANGDLLQKIQQNGRINETESRFYFRQLIEALSYLKSLNIVHRDIKCENILLDSHNNVKLTDFGFARYIKPNEMSHTFCGSRAYVAPELLQSFPYDGILADTWSAGVVLYVMVVGLMPYDDRDVYKMTERQLQHKITFSPRVPVSAEVKDLIRAMLHPFPKKRLSYSEIITSPWLVNTKYEIRSGSTPTCGQESPSS